MPQINPGYLNGPAINPTAPGFASPADAANQALYGMVNNPFSRSPMGPFMPSALTPGTPWSAPSLNGMNFMQRNVTHAGMMPGPTSVSGPIRHPTLNAMANPPSLAWPDVIQFPPEQTVAPGYPEGTVEAPAPVYEDPYYGGYPGYSYPGYDYETPSGQAGGRARYQQPRRGYQRSAAPQRYQGNAQMQRPQSAALQPSTPRWYQDLVTWRV